jgi:hypothetical protein
MLSRGFLKLVMMVLNITITREIKMDSTITFHEHYQSARHFLIPGLYLPP